MEKVIPQDRYSMPRLSLFLIWGPAFYFLIFCPLLTLWETSTISNAQLVFSISFIILYAPLTFDNILLAVAILRARSGVNFCQVTIKSAEILVTKSHLKGKGSYEIKQRSEKSLVEGGRDQGSWGCTDSAFPPYRLCRLGSSLQLVLPTSFRISRVLEVERQWNCSLFALVMNPLQGTAKLTQWDLFGSCKSA